MSKDLVGGLCGLMWDWMRRMASWILVGSGGTIILTENIVHISYITCTTTVILRGHFLFFFPVFCLVFFVFPFGCPGLA